MGCTNINHKGLQRTVTSVILAIFARFVIKNQDLEKEEPKKYPKMSANIAKIAKVTRIFLAS